MLSRLFLSINEINFSVFFDDSRKWVNKAWQPAKKIFPPVVFVSPYRFNLESDRVHFKQVDHIGMLMELEQQQQRGIRLVL